MLKGICYNASRQERRKCSLNLFGAWPSRPMTEVVSDVLGETVTMDTPVEELAAHAKKHGIEVKSDWGPGKIIAEIYDEIGEDSIVNPTFVCDYPLLGPLHLRMGKISKFK